MTNSVLAEGTAGNSVHCWTKVLGCPRRSGTQQTQGLLSCCETLGTWHKTQARTLSLPPLKTSEGS